MIQAELHRKFTSNEDQFVSTVLGLLSYLVPAHGVLRLISRARPLGREGLGRLAAEMDIPTNADVQVLYWPRTRHHGVPDALVVVRSGGTIVRLVVIEAKLGSGKSQWSEDSDDDDSNDAALEPSAAELADQLARYWQALKGGAFEGIERLPAEQCAVIYLTHHALMPIDDLRETCSRAADVRLAWLSWHDVWRMATELASAVDLGRTERAITSDLCAFLAYRGFAAFHGFDFVDAMLESERWKLKQERWEFTGTTSVSG